jgi:hypothetical protein
MMKNRAWPLVEREAFDRFGEVFTGAITTIRGYEIEDRFGLYHRKAVPQPGNSMLERFSWRILTISRLSYAEFLQRFAPDEWERVNQRLAPRGRLLVKVLGAHPRGRTVSTEEETRIFESLGLQHPASYREIG